jgi:hypothetical protein
MHHHGIIFMFTEQRKNLYMKKFFTLFLLACYTLLAQAQSTEGVFSFTNLSRQDILIEVDGKQYADCGAAMTIRNLSFGYYKVKVYGEKFRRNNTRRLLYDHGIWVRSRVFVDIIVNRFGKVFVDEQEVNGRWPDEGDPPIVRAMNDQLFQTFFQTIKKEHFDDARMAIANPMIAQNYFTAEQVKQLVPLFSFDKNKLAMAKNLYGRTIDPENYFIVYDAFDFSSTKLDLVEYIKNYK